MEKEIGKITHFFGKISVGVIKLTDELRVGETIKIVGHDREFSQTVSSMQIEHQNVEKAGKGESIGLKVDQPVKKGDVVYKITE